MKRGQGQRRTKSGGNEYDDQEEEGEILYPEGQLQPRVLNLQHYVGHSLVKQQQQQQQPPQQQQQQSSPPPNFRPLSRTQQPVSYPTKSHKPGLKLAHSNGSNKQSELTCLQRRAAELTGMPLINFNIKRSASVRGSEGPIENEVTLKNDKQLKFEDFNPHQHPPLYQPHQIHNLVVQQHLRFLSAYQHSGLLALKAQGMKELPPVSPTTLGPVLPDPNQDRILRKNYSMCEDLLMDQDSTMKNLWDKDCCVAYDFSMEEQLSQANNRVNFKLGATLSLPQMLLVAEVNATKEVNDSFSSRNTEFQMGKEDEARFLPTDLLSDDTTTTTVDQPLPQLSNASSTAAHVELSTSFETDNDYGYTDAKSLPTFLNESCHNKKQSLRKTLSLQGDHNNNNNNLFSAGSSDFSLFPQTGQSDLLCSLRSSLVKSSVQNSEQNKSRVEIEDENGDGLLGLEALQQELQQFPPPSSRKITTSRHLERAIKSLSINTDISRKF